MYFVAAGSALGKELNGMNDSNGESFGIGSWHNYMSVLCGFSCRWRSY